MATLRIPDVVPSPAEDAETLMKSFKGLGTNEKSVISVLGHRNASQRKKIRETYQQLYNRSLVDDIFSELSGDFKKAVVLWTYEPSERDARLANEALKSKKKTITQLQVIVEIACASSPDHLVAVRQTYRGLFNCSLEEDIAANVPMPVQKVLIGLVSSYRYDKELVDPSIANKESAILRETIRTKQLDSDNFLLILSTRNVHQLRTTFECYKQNYGFSIDQDMKSCGKGLLESILKVVIWCIDSPEKHFAEVVRASIVGIGTDENSLTRAIVTRAEVDMMKVRGEYFIANKSNLDSAVIGDTSGDYMKFLMTLLGAKV
ncbi:annexin D3-like isoform X1 [Solanum pennellii]|uniref:Annexin n=1 Tax=Solanum pennellii TaxID=28526 RepID=A0ABM1VA95_SOLPN|nr:annexin D3-like isoform X2 [Solanum pennellii]XP_027772663.1 annexin D3-like isoform X1 [Solanum pennellii]